MRKEREIVAALREHGAVSEKTAISIERKRGFELRVMRSLLKHGAVKEAASSAFYLDEAAYDDMRAKRRSRGMVVAVISVVLLGAVAILLASNVLPL
ncbi:MAG: hypothetical protein NT015_15510 [Alphaproteobacteria bacterium]|nr:hypothetical protein [Alphaproteobacteria bacterium]